MRVARIEPEDLPDGIDALAGACPFVPYRTYRRQASAGAFEALARGWLRNSTAAASGAFGAWAGGALCGVACWRSLAWDTEQFGFPAARIEALAVSGDYARARAQAVALVEALRNDCRAAGIRHLTARVDAEDLAALHALGETGFELIDGIQTFSIGTGPKFAADTAIEIRLFEQEDLDPLLAIARSAYSLDRFHADAALGPGVADAVNESWVRNSCLGSAADAVVVAAVDREPLGYVTCQLDRRAAPLLGSPLGRIVMVATAQKARGRGIGRAATLGALEWFGRNGASTVEVGTQLRNVPAARLYEGCGFRLNGVSLTLRNVLTPKKPATPSNLSVF